MSDHSLTVADLPASMRAPGQAVVTPARPLPIQVLTCQHGVACPECVLAAARALVRHDATLTGQVYTG